MSLWGNLVQSPPTVNNMRTTPATPTDVGTVRANLTIGGCRPRPVAATDHRAIFRTLGDYPLTPQLRASARKSSRVAEGPANPGSPRMHIGRGGLIRGTTYGLAARSARGRKLEDLAGLKGKRLQLVRVHQRRDRDAVLARKTVKSVAWLDLDRSARQMLAGGGLGTDGWSAPRSRIGWRGINDGCRCNGRWWCRRDR